MHVGPAAHLGAPQVLQMPQEAVPAPPLVPSPLEAVLAEIRELRADLARRTFRARAQRLWAWIRSFRG